MQAESCFISFLILLVGMGASPRISGAQTQDELKQRLALARQETMLDADGMVPWHMKFAIQLQDKKGATTEQGTVDELWVSPQKRKVVYDLPSFKGTELFLADEVYRTKGLDVVPVTVEELLTELLHPLGSAGEVDQSAPELRKHKFGKVELECIMLSQPAPGVAFPPLGLFPTYCFDLDKPTLRMTFDLGSMAFVRNQVGTFRGHSVATQLTLEENDLKVATGQVLTLATMTPHDQDFVPTSEMEKAENEPVALGSVLTAGRVLNKVPPRYPDSDKQRHVQGTVVLHAIIKPDGTIRSLQVVSTPDPSLALAAIEAVRQWRYTPYLLNGKPRAVKTKVVVNFAMRQ